MLNKHYKVKHAVLMLVYNRVDTALKVVDQLRMVQPERIYIAADGPKPNKQDEENCSLLRTELLKSFDWQCEVKTLFRPANLGCRKAVNEGISWFFEHEEQGIILEDDTVPSQSFFQFCDELLVHYQSDENVSHISGFNGFNVKVADVSYVFNHLPNIWGWATWRRSWNRNMQYSESELLQELSGKVSWIEWHYWKRMLKKKPNTWDFQYAISIASANKRCILPAHSLVENIGFGQSNSTNTFNVDHPLAGIRAKEMDFPLKSPQTFSMYAPVEKEISRTLQNLLVREWIEILLVTLKLKKR